MRRRISAVTCAALMTVLATARGGTPPPNSVSWILVGGANLALQRRMHLSGPEGHTVTLGDAKRFAGMQLGGQLHAPATSPQLVTTDLNPTTQATGMIAGPGPFKECHDMWHYHGFLYGAHDSGLNCGWGEAVPFDMATDALGFLSEATMLEIRAANRLDALPPDTAGAVDQLNQAHDALQNCAQAAATLQGKLNNEDIRTIGHEAAKAALADGIAVTQIQKGGSIIPSTVDVSLNQAAKHKRKILRKLMQRGALLK